MPHPKRQFKSKKLGGIHSAYSAGQGQGFDRTLTSPNQRTSSSLTVAEERTYWENAFSRLKALQGQTEAYRLPPLRLPSTPKDPPPWILEAFGPVWIGYDYGGGVEVLRQLAESLTTSIRPEAWVVLDRKRATGRSRENPEWIMGKPIESFAVQENGLHFEIHPAHSGNPGLFLDTRDLRQHLLKTSIEKKVLNLFSYTCSLGIAAAKGGAKQIVNVDISKPYLEWGQRNAQLNSLKSSSIEFRAMESERYVEWAIRKGHTFEIVILDPPVFSQTSRGTYRFERDYFKLLERCWQLVASGGELFALTNYTKISETDFRHHALKSIGESLAEWVRLPAPIDFPGNLSFASPLGGCLAFSLKKEV
jgi:23S rRNA G2069 N7-methylase RlmK/C1962 C5-methylase RlmI